MSLREQFETWLNVTSERYIISNSELYWQAFQAGHGASGRDELLEALEAALGCDAEMEGVDSNLPKWLKEQLQSAIKKARGEQ